MPVDHQRTVILDVCGDALDITHAHPSTEPWLRARHSDRSGCPVVSTASTASTTGQQLRAVVGLTGLAREAGREGQAWKAVWFTLIPTPRTTNRTRSASADSSARIPPSLCPFAVMRSLGHFTWQSSTSAMAAAQAKTHTGAN